MGNLPLIIKISLNPYFLSLVSVSNRLIQEKYFIDTRSPKETRNRTSQFEDEDEIEDELEINT